MNIVHTTTTSRFIISALIFGWFSFLSTDVLTNERVIENGDDRLQASEGSGGDELVEDEDEEPDCD